MACAKGLGQMDQARRNPQGAGSFDHPAGLQLVNYEFGTGIASHYYYYYYYYYCGSCGIHTFTHLRAAPQLFTVNVRTLDDFDLALAAPAVFEFDGRHWEANIAKLG